MRPFAAAAAGLAALALATGAAAQQEELEPPLALARTGQTSTAVLSQTDLDALNALFASTQRGVGADTVYFSQCGVSPVSTPAWTWRSLEERGRRFNHGALNARLCAVAAIDALRNPGILDAGFSNPEIPLRFSFEAVRDLEYFYQRRAERQQTLIDWSSGVTVFGAAGAAASGRVGAATQRAWGYAALLPVVMGQLNAHEPTRNLYTAGALGLTLVRARYTAIWQAAGLIDGASIRSAAVPGDSSSLANPANCVGRFPAFTPAGNAGDEQNATRLIYEAERVRLVQACMDLAYRVTRLEQFDQHLGGINASLAHHLAADAHQLDQRLLQQDRELRYTPLETLRSLASAPVRAVDTLISGQDVQGSLSGFQSATALEGLDITLAAISLPEPPARMNEAIAASTTVVMRLYAANETTARTLVESALALDSARMLYNEQVGHAEAAVAAQSARRLRVRYDTSVRGPVAELASEGAIVQATVPPASE